MSALKEVPLLGFGGGLSGMDTIRIKYSPLAVAY